MARIDDIREEYERLERMMEQLREEEGWLEEQARLEQEDAERLWQEEEFVQDASNDE